MQSAPNLPELPSVTASPTGTPTAPAISQLAQSRLRAAPYRALSVVACEYRDGVLTLRGSLSSYYLRHVAQTTVAGINGVDRVENLIEVLGRTWFEPAVV